MTKRAFILSAAVAASVLVGCNILRDNRQFRYPADIKHQCESCCNVARDRIASVDGKRPGLDLKCSVRKIAGEKLIGQVWCWKWGKYWVGGLTYFGDKGCAIEIGSDPKTGAVHSEVLIHEFAHYVLWDLHKIMRHDARYAKLFTGWREPAGAAAQREWIDGPDGMKVHLEIYGEVGK